jgi:hypothetical protein
MATLILEIDEHHGRIIHRIDREVTRIGRAYDNDVIVTEPTVSPHHFVIRRNPDATFTLYPLTDENGIRVDGRRLETPLTLAREPLKFSAGRVTMRLLDPATPVPPTRLIGCRDGRCIFGNRGWAIALFAILVLLTAVENFLATPKEITWDTYWRDQVVIVVSLALIAIGMMLLLRLAARRWDFPSSLSFVSLFIGLGLLLGFVTPFADYYFNSAWPSQLVDVAWSLLIMPAALGWFLIRVHHGNSALSLVIVVIVLSPTAYFQLRDVMAYHDLTGSFSTEAYYSDVLVPWDRRIVDTMPLAEFAELQTQYHHRESNDGSD